VRAFGRGLHTGYVRVSNDNLSNELKLTNSDSTILFDVTSLMILLKIETSGLQNPGYIQNMVKR